MGNIWTIQNGRILLSNSKIGTKDSTNCYNCCTPNCEECELCIGVMQWEGLGIRRTNPVIPMKCRSGGSGTPLVDVYLEYDFTALEQPIYLTRKDHYSLPQAGRTNFIAEFGQAVSRSALSTVLGGGGETVLGALFGDGSGSVSSYRAFPVVKITAKSVDDDSTVRTWFPNTLAAVRFIGYDYAWRSSAFLSIYAGAAASSGYPTYNIPLSVGSMGNAVVPSLYIGSTGVGMGTYHTYSLGGVTDERIYPNDRSYLDCEIGDYTPKRYMLSGADNGEEYYNCVTCTDAKRAAILDYWRCYGHGYDCDYDGWVAYWYFDDPIELDSSVKCKVWHWLTNEVPTTVCCHGKNEPCRDLKCESMSIAECAEKNGIAALSSCEDFEFGSEVVADFEDANFVVDDKTIVETGAFTNYVFRSGDTIQITGGTNIVTGTYEIEEKIDNDKIKLYDNILYEQAEYPFSGGMWLEAWKQLVGASNPFAEYSYKAGDTCVIDSGTNVTPGTYDVAARLDPGTIELVQSIGSDNFVGDIVGSALQWQDVNDNSIAGSITQTSKCEGNCDDGPTEIEFDRVSISNIDGSGVTNSLVTVEEQAACVDPDIPECGEGVWCVKRKAFLNTFHIDESAVNADKFMATTTYEEYVGTDHPDDECICEDTVEFDDEWVDINYEIIPTISVNYLKCEVSWKLEFISKYTHESATVSILLKTIDGIVSVAKLVADEGVIDVGTVTLPILPSSSNAYIDAPWHYSKLIDGLPAEEECYRSEATTPLQEFSLDLLINFDLTPVTCEDEE